MVIPGVANLGKDGSEEETDGDSPLVAGDDGTANPSRSALRLVHGDEGGNQTDTKTSDNTTNIEKRPLGSTSLHCDTGDEDDISDEKRLFPTESISQRL